MTCTTRLLVRGMLLAGVLTVAWLAPVAGQDANRDLVAQGAKVYGNVCGTCHNARSPLERNDSQWAIIMSHMRVRANLTGNQSRAVLAFLQATNGIPSVTGAGAVGPQEDEAEVSDAAPDLTLAPAGEALVAEKACLGCHIIAGTGAQIGPSLDGVVGRRGARFVRQKLKDPKFNNSTSMMPNFGLTDEQVEALTAYMATLNGQ